MDNHMVNLNITRICVLTSLCNTTRNVISVCACFWRVSNLHCNKGINDRTNIKTFLKNVWQYMAILEQFKFNFLTALLSRNSPNVDFNQ